MVREDLYGTTESDNAGIIIIDCRFLFLDKFL